MWKSFDIKIKQFEDPVFEITNPFMATKKITFMADVPHTIKNLNAALVNGQTIRYKDRKVSIASVEMLSQYQHDNELKVIYYFISVF